MKIFNKSVSLALVLLCVSSIVLLSACNNKGSDDKGKSQVVEISNLQELKNGLEKGGEYRLTADISSEEGLEIAQNKTVSINLNDKKIVCSNDGVALLNKGTLNLKNGFIYSTNIEAQGRIAIKNEGTFTGDNLYLGSKNSRGNAIRNYGTAKVCNSNFDCCDNFINGNGYAYPITNSSGTLTIENCTYNGSANGVFGADSGTINVNGGSYVLTGDNNYYMFYLDEGTINVNGGIFIRTTTTLRKMAYTEQQTLDALKINGGMLMYNGANWTKENN